jgi:hypothetical protein
MCFKTLAGGLAANVAQQVRDWEADQAAAAAAAVAPIVITPTN